MRNDLFDLTGRIAVVTGAYRGLGLAIARGMARHGATVVLNGRRSRCPGEPRDVLRGEGLAAEVAPFDVTERNAVRAGIAAIEARHGRIDVLVNNAGIQRRAALADFPQEGLGRR